MPPMLTYLAMVIDIREERLERTTIPFLQRQLQLELDRLFERFAAEYSNYLTTSGNTDPAELLRLAA